MKMYGPYTRKDGRKHLCIVRADGSRQTLSYPRYLMQLHLGRALLPHEHVDHVNNDKLDNTISNLQLLSLRENNHKHSALHPEKMHEFICPCCNAPAIKRLRDVTGNKKKNKSGPYCSRSCAGKHTHLNHWAGSSPVSGTKGQT